jgi:hypothetical protein
LLRFYIDLFFLAASRQISPTVATPRYPAAKGHPSPRRSPAAVIAFCDPRLGAVVVATHSREWAVGDVVDITLPQDEATKA